METLRSQRFKIPAIMAVIALTVLMSLRDTERLGDRLQFALPILGLGCAAVNGTWGEYVVRFVGLEVILHSSKNGLGTLPINQRPDGGIRGFPSGHTTAAVYGASALLRECIEGNWAVKTTIILAAAFVGGSRIEAERHTTWQVLFGALLGLFCDRAARGWLMPMLRRKSLPYRQQLARKFTNLK